MALVLKHLHINNNNKIGKDRKNIDLNGYDV